MSVPYSHTKTAHRRAKWLRLTPALALACSLTLAGCGGAFTETFQRGYVMQEGALSS